MTSAPFPTESTPAESLPSGIAVAELDPAVRPQDDLFRHVNGRWIERTEIPTDRARYGSFYLLAEDAERAVRDIILDAQDAEAGTDARKVGDLFRSFMAEELIEENGVEPILDQLTTVDAVDSIPGLLHAVGALSREGVPGFLSLYVDNDPGDPLRYLPFLEQGGLGLPDESYYREEKFASIRVAYRSHLERMFTLAGLDDATGRAERTMELELTLASQHWDNVRTRDSEATYNLMSWVALTERIGTAGLDLAPLLVGWGAGPDTFDTVVVREPSFLDGLAAALTADRLPAWRDWLSWQVIRGSAGLLSSDIVAANFDFYGTTLSGTPELRERWKRGVSLVEGAMGEAIGRVYVARHFPAQAKASMDELVANLIAAYRESIAGLTWMGEETRARALEKLSKFTPKIGYPEKWRDYSSLSVDPADVVGNARRTSRFEFDRELRKIGRPIDRDEWFMTPQTVNAYYNPGFNEIVFPAAILQHPFFDAGRDPAANYGAIGAVIGHEIGHGFDDQGSKFDGDGRLTDWWTAQDRAAFEELTGALTAQYSVLAPRQAPEHFVNGALTVGENIGDLGGLGIAWKAYLISLDGRQPPVVDELTGAQRFFLSWAQAWQMKGRDEEVIRLLAIDPHSPSEFRCNQIVRNIAAFYDAFGVTETDALWLPAEQRVTIW